MQMGGFQASRGQRQAQRSSLASRGWTEPGDPAAPGHSDWRKVAHDPGRSQKAHFPYHFIKRQELDLRAPLVISEEMLSIVDKPYQEWLSEPITYLDVTRWERSVYWPQLPPARSRDERLVPLDFNPFAWQPNGDAAPYPDGPDDYLEGLAGARGPGATVGVNGELRASFCARMRIGDQIATVTRIRGYQIRRGSGGPLLLTDVERQWHRQDGHRVKLEANIVVRW